MGFYDGTTRAMRVGFFAFCGAAVAFLLRMLGEYSHSNLLNYLAVLIIIVSLAVPMVGCSLFRSQANLAAKVATSNTTHCQLIVLDKVRRTASAAQNGAARSPQLPGAMRPARCASSKTTPQAVKSAAALFRQC